MLRFACAAASIDCAPINSVQKGSSMKISSRLWPLAISFSALASAFSHAQTVEIATIPGKAQDGYSLVGYVFKPSLDKFSAPFPAVVLVHGRAGAYSANAKGIGCDGTFTPNNCFNAGTLSARISSWASRLQQMGYLTLVLDSFGSKGTPEGFAAGTFGDRAAMFDPKVARVGDSYAALSYLRGILGWSNGGTTTLNTVGSTNGFLSAPTPTTGFRAAVSFYPGCGTASLFMTNYSNYAPTLVFLAQDDAEVDPIVCRNVINQAAQSGASISFKFFPDTDHYFDDPSASTQNVKLNRASTTDARRRAELFLEANLKN
jgi:carboxymethylenebutenolidase